MHDKNSIRLSVLVWIYVLTILLLVRAFVFLTMSDMHVLYCYEVTSGHSNNYLTINMLDIYINSLLFTCTCVHTWTYLHVYNLLYLYFWHLHVRHTSVCVTFMQFQLCIETNSVIMFWPSSARCHFVLLIDVLWWNVLLLCIVCSAWHGFLIIIHGFLLQKCVWLVL